MTYHQAYEKVVGTFNRMKRKSWNFWIHEPIHEPTGEKFGIVGTGHHDFDEHGEFTHDIYEPTHADKNAHDWIVKEIEDLSKPEHVDSEGL